MNNVAFIEAALDDPEHFDIDANVDNLKMMWKTVLIMWITC